MFVVYCLIFWLAKLVDLRGIHAGVGVLGKGGKEDVVSYCDKQESKEAHLTFW